MVRCICIDDRNKPKDYPKQAKWLIKDATYNIIRIEWKMHQRLWAVQLNEIEDDLAPYYGWFKLDRFAVPDELLGELEWLKIATRETKGLEVNVEELLKTELLEEV